MIEIEFRMDGAFCVYGHKLLFTVNDYMNDQRKAIFCMHLT